MRGLILMMLGWNLEIKRAWGGVHPLHTETKTQRELAGSSFADQPLSNDSQQRHKRARVHYSTFGKAVMAGALTYWCNSIIRQEQGLITCATN